MKRMFSMILALILLMLLTIPYFILAEYNNRLNELEAQIIILQQNKYEIEKQVRLNTQDILIMNNIIFEKDFIKTLD